MQIKPQMKMKVGRKSYAVASFADASAMFVTARDASGMGASEIPTPLLFEGEKLIAYVAYNGRVFEGRPQEWKPGTRMLYEGRC